MLVMVRIHVPVALVVQRVDGACGAVEVLAQVALLISVSKLVKAHTRS